MQVRFRFLAAAALAAFAPVGVMGAPPPSTAVRGEAPAALGRVFGVEELRGDLYLLRSVLLEAHPGLDRFNDRRALVAFVDEVFRAIDRPLTEKQFYRLLTRIHDVIRCGHTRLLPSREFVSASLGHDLFLPVQPAISGDRAWIRYDLTEGGELGEGSEILAINGRPFAELLRDLEPMISGDGQVRSSRSEKLAADFAYWYGWLVEAPETHELEVRRRGEKAARRVRVAALANGAMAAHREKRYGPRPSAEPPGELEIVGDGTALLTLRSLFNGSFEKADMEFGSFLRSSFRRLAGEGIERLVVDLRGNGGGNDENGKLLLSYLIDEELPYYADITLRTRIFSFFDHTPIPEEGVAELLELFSNFSLGEDAVYRWRENPKLRPVQPSQPQFHGQVVVLIDGGSFSGAAEVAALLHHQKRALFVGQETGGAYLGNNSGPATDIHLPASGIRFHIPFYRYDMAVSGGGDPSRGVLPDHPVAPTIEDLLADRDPALELALELKAPRESPAGRRRR